MIQHAARPDPACADDRVRDLLAQVRSRALGLLGRYRIPAADSEDLMQQTLLTYLVRHDGVRDPEAWLLGTLRNQCLLYWRRRRERPSQALEDALEAGLTPAAAPEQEVADIRHDLELALARLPEHCRTVLLRRYALGYRATELAESLDQPAATVRKIATRCLQALARELRAVDRAGDGAGEEGLASVLHRDRLR